MECVSVTFVRMHAEQVMTDADLVRRLLRAQHPHLADLPIERVPTDGTDNAVYRLGAELVARLPLIDWAVPQVALEREWLPRVAPLLPVPIPEPVEAGEPGEGYPWPWSVYRWLDGASADPSRILDQDALAHDVAELVLAFRAIDLPDIPRSGRGFPLRLADEEMRTLIEELRGELADADALLAAWSAAVEAPSWDGGWVTVHGDLTAGNLLVDGDGRLAAVIDFSLFGRADPANDLEVAWDIFDPPARAIFRSLLDVDDATWARGRGWTIRSIVGIPYYRETNPGIVERSRRRLANVMAEAS
jgi:aminoglycoside phosphotransferase (APT) family kinase protein